MRLIESASTPTAERSDEDLRRFHHMMGETRRRAYTMALQLTRNPSDAEDLMQDTYVKAWKGFDSYIPGRPFLNWLLRIMQRAYLDSRRRDNPIRKAESLNSMIWILRPSFSATFFTCSKICAWGPPVTPILRGLSWAIAPVENAAAAAKAKADCRRRRLLLFTGKTFRKEMERILGFSR